MAEDEAYRKGYLAAAAHTPWDGYEINPYTSEPKKSNWLRGYRNADKEYSSDAWQNPEPIPTRKHE